MLIRVGCEIEFVFPEPTALMLMLSLHPLRLPRFGSTKICKSIRRFPSLSIFDTNGNRCGRAVVPAGRVRFRNDAIVEDCGLPDLQVPERAANQRPRLAARGAAVSAGQPLLRSRQRTEGHRLDAVLADAAGWPRVQAVCDFVHRHIRFDYSRPGPIARRSKSIASGSASAATTCTWRSRSAAA